MQCPPTRWIDLSPEHKQLREELESHIKAYVEGLEKTREHYTYFIVAPYGSGKTELFRYLCNWCVKRGIPVVLIELREIVDYLEKELRKLGKAKFHESEMPEVLEKFFVHKSGKDIKRRGVMLIDEIEEAYSELKNIVQFTTSPFRGVFEKVRNGQLLFLPIFAFGPSSALMELSGLIGWRIRIVSIPLIDSATIKQMIVERGVEQHLCYVDEQKRSRYIKLLANMLWWLGKGRIGWLSRILDEKIVENVIANIQNIERGLLSIDEKRHLFSEKHMMTLESEIVQGVHIFDVDEYIKIYSEAFATSPNLRKLFSILAVLVGPLPISEIKRIIKEDFSGIKMPKEFVCSRYAISKEMILERIVEVTEKYIEKSKEYTESEKKKVINDVRRIVDLVLDTWSYNDVILYDQRTYHEYMDTLKNVAISLALELYKEEVVGILDKIDMIRIVDDLQDKVFLLEEEYCAISPSALIRIYPMVMIRPLIACAKVDPERLEIELHKEMVDLMNASRVNDEIRKLLTDVAGLSNIKVKLYHVPSPEVARDYKLSIINRIKDNPEELQLLVPLATSGKKLDQLAEKLAEEFRSYISTGLVQSANVGPRLSLFLAGLAYSILKCPTEFKSLTSIEKYILRQYLSNYKKIIMEEVNKYYSIVHDFELAVQREVSQLEDAFRRLDEQGYRVVGGERATYIWISSVGSSRLHELIDKILGTIRALNEEVAKVKDVLYYESSEDNKSLSDVMFEEISLLTKEQASRYVRDSVKTANDFVKIIERSEALRNLGDVARDIIKETFKDANSLCADFKNKLDEILPILGKILRGLSSKSAHYIFVSYTIKPIIDNHCKEHAKSYMSKIRSVESMYSRLKGVLVNLDDSIRRLMQKMENLGVNAPHIEHQLKIVKNFINNVDSQLRDIVKAVLEAQTSLSDSSYNLQILSNFVIGSKDSIINKLFNNIETALKSIKLKDYINEVLGGLDELERQLNSLEEDVVEALNRLLKRDIKEEALKDLRTIFESSPNIKDLAKNLKDYCDKRYIENIKKAYCRYAEIMKGAEIDKNIEKLRRSVERVINRIR